MKTLATIAMFQTACILFLLYQVTAGNVPPVASRDARPLPVAVLADETAATPPGTTHEARLRQIIREELQAYAAAGFTAAGEPAAPRNARDDEDRSDFVRQQLAYLRSAGTVSPDEMNDLLREIAKLDNAGRREAMRTLMRAMNSGEIKGQL